MSEDKMRQKELSYMIKSFWKKRGYDLKVEIVIDYIHSVHEIKSDTINGMPREKYEDIISRIG